MKKIGMIGVGNMGSALAKGFINSQKVSPTDLVLYDVDTPKLTELNTRIGFTAAESIDDQRLYETDALIIAVKPQILDDLLKRIRSMVGPNIVLVSIAAGVPTERLLANLESGARVIRVMPNAGAMFEQAATALCPGGVASEDDARKVADLFSSVGKAVIVEEKYMDAVTALSGGGPAFLFAIMEAMTDAAVMMGMDRHTAKALTIQTFRSAAEMAERSTISFSDLKDMITSPGGTTIAGIRVLEKAGLRGTVMDVIEAAAKRSAELGAK